LNIFHPDYLIGRKGGYSGTESAYTKNTGMVSIREEVSHLLLCWQGCLPLANAPA